MSQPRQLLFRRDDRHKSSALSTTLPVEPAKTTPMKHHVDHRALLRTSSTASTRAGNVIDLMSERSRMNCSTMRSQF